VRPFDIIRTSYETAEPAQKHYWLARLGDMPLDFETDALLHFLESVVVSPIASLSLEARRSLHRLKPHYLMGGTGVSSAAAKPASTGWTAHVYKISKDDQPDLASPVKLEELAKIPRERYMSAALDLLTPLADRLATLASSQDKAVRTAAVDALGGFPHPEALSGLARALEEPKYAGLAALSLSRIGSPGAHQLVNSGLDRYKGKPEEADFALALGSFPVREALTRLATLVGSPSVEVRSAVARACGELANLGPEPLLLRLAADPDPVVALWALEALRSVAVPEAADVVASAFFRFQQPTVQVVALRALGRIAGPRASSTAIAAVKHASAVVRAQAVETLVALKLTEAELYRWTAPLVRDADPRVASAAVVALAPIFRGKTLEWIDAATNAASAPARAAGAWALTYVQGNRSLNHLKNLLKKEQDGTVLVQLTKALAKYHGPETVAVLLDCLKHQEVQVRQTAARLLPLSEARGDRAAFTRLREALDAEVDPVAQGVMLVGLARLSGALMTEGVYNKYLKATHPFVRQSVVEAVDLLNAQNASAELRNILKGDDAPLKPVVARTLWHLGDTKSVVGIEKDLETTEPDRQLSACLAAGEVAASLSSFSDTSQHVLLSFALKRHIEATGRSRQMDLGKQQTPVRALSTDQFEYNHVLALESELVAAFGGSKAPSAPAETGSGVFTGPKRMGGLALMETAEQDAVSAQSAPRIPRPAIARPEATVPPRTESAVDSGIALEKSLAQLVAGDYAAAQQLLEPLIATDYGPAYYLRARLTQLMLEPSEEHLAAAVRRLPHCVDAAWDLACDEQLIGKDDLGACLEAVRRYHGLVGQRIELVQAALDAGDRPRAQSILNELVTDMAGLESAHVQNGKANYQTKNWETALEHLELAHIRLPQDGAITLFLASACRRTGRRSYARALLERLVQQPELDSELMTRARALLSETKSNDN
jgi:HEAT repeat protein/tetratricopeptide (TPR) repeat protein